jgi:uncharacterized protein YbbC (DUF1343 family)
MRIALGSDRLLESTLLHDRCVGLVSNPASVDRRLQHTADRLASREDLTLAALFGPQHGFAADVQDNMVQTGHAHHHRWGVPIYSLYSETREPTAEMLVGLDVLVVDLQNVGARIYTFIHTMANCLRAAKRHGVPVIVCDRPNPIGGVDVEGPVLDPGFESFVGQFPIPMRHGMTIGELARLFNEHFGIGAKLTVVAMAGWQRDMYWDDTGLPWVMPSPNMPTLDTAIVYPGMVLFEGTNLSEGRGTTRPFEISGAPWIDARRLAEQMNDAAIPGVWFRPVRFEPTFQKHARQACGGCQIHVTRRQVFKPVLTGAALLAEARRLDPERFAWRQPPYEYEEAKWPIDILAGSDELRLQIDADVPALEIAASWEDDVRRFLPVRERFLLY